MGMMDFSSNVMADGQVHIVRTDNGGQMKGQFAEL